MPLILSHFKGGDNESFQEDIDIWKKKIPYLKKSIPADIAIPLLKNLFDVNLKKISGLESNYHMLQVPHKYGFIGSGTVSYTHLDVYKRQNIYSPVIDKNNTLWATTQFGSLIQIKNGKLKTYTLPYQMDRIVSEFDNGDYLSFTPKGAVSYTHLDVYKRQWSQCGNFIDLLNEEAGTIKHIKGFVASFSEDKEGNMLSLIHI